MDPEQYEYENEHADTFHDYEEDAMQDQQSEEEEDRYFDEFSNDDNSYNEDLGWDGDYED